MTGKQKLHSWSVLISMTVLSWLVANIWIIEITLIEFFFIVVLLGFSDYFCIFVDKKILKITEVKPKDKQG